MTTLRSRLRERTRVAHDRVDAAFSGHDLTTRCGYVEFLRRHASAVLALEAALDRGQAQLVVSDWEARRRSSALLQDLARLGASVPNSLPVPELAHPAEVLGALYVIEGSRLGARLLVLQVERFADEAVRGATAYLRHGAGTALWPSFVAVLERSPYAVEAPDLVVAGALLTFTLFERAAGIDIE